jgi:hypothetical protein
MSNQWSTGTKSSWGQSPIVPVALDLWTDLTSEGRALIMDFLKRRGDDEF